MKYVDEPSVINGSYFEPCDVPCVELVEMRPITNDVPRGVSLLVTGSVVTATLTPYQDDLANADYYFLGGHEYVINQEKADVLINAGYGDYLTPLVED